MYNSFIEKNPNLKNEIDLLNLDLIKINEFLDKNDELFKLNNITKNVVHFGILSSFSYKYYMSCPSKLNAYNCFINLMDKINQRDSDIKKLKDNLQQNAKYFPKPEEQKLINFNLNLQLISKELIPFVIERLKYEDSNLLEHLSIQIPISLLAEESIFLELSSIITNSPYLSSILISVNKGTITTDYPICNIDSIEPIINAIRNNYRIRNIGIGCIDCVGEMGLSMQNSISCLLNDYIFSFGLSNLNFDMESFTTIIERLIDIKRINLLFYECPENTYNKVRTDQLNIITNSLQESEIIRMIYLMGYDECSSKDKSNCINTLRKKGYIQEIIIDVPLRFAIQKLDQYS